MATARSLRPQPPAFSRPWHVAAHACHHGSTSRRPACDAGAVGPSVVAPAVQDLTSSSNGTASQQQLSSLAQVIRHGAKMTTAAHTLWAEVVKPGDTVIDATCGNGHDATYLVSLVGPSGTYIGIDIQAAAINATRAQLAASLALPTAAANASAEISAAVTGAAAAAASAAASDTGGASANVTGTAGTLNAVDGVSSGPTTSASAVVAGSAGTLNAVDDISAAATTSISAAAAAAARPEAAATYPVQLHCMCHSEMGRVVAPGSVSLVAFNLGYLPSGDKSIITHADHTVPAIAAALDALKEGGLVSILAYIGHEGGMEEYRAVEAFLSSLSPKRWITSETSQPNRPGAPHLLCAWKRPGA